LIGGSGNPELAQKISAALKMVTVRFLGKEGKLGAEVPPCASE
jgi:hypothetical protein